MCSETEIKRNELHRKIDRLWEIFWTGGITNPLDVVEQMTYLMFIKDLDSRSEKTKRIRYARYPVSEYFFR